MHLPRLNFRLRTLMILVGLVAVVTSGMIQVPRWRRRSERYRVMAGYAEQEARENRGYIEYVREQVVTSGITQAEGDSIIASYVPWVEYYDSQARAWRYRARFPFFAPDPSPPPRRDAP
ncbi:MAG TPA: hypothetical protein VG406_21885 [Isosphaeraceae bacterium]|jgi:hypothetical protein|nr:hypothetical protein [Isosphaeraceae bacterium]